METFGSRLRDAAIAKGARTPQELGRLCGVSRQTAKNWLDMAKPTMPAIVLLNVAQRLGVRMFWLCTGDGPMLMSQQFMRSIHLFDALAEQPEALERWLQAAEEMVK